MAERTSLPNRRRQETRDVDFGGQHYAVSAGLDPEGRVLEIFTTTSKQGVGLDALLHDAMILASIALQHGATPSDLRRSMSRLGGGLGSATAAASPVGRVLDVVAVIEAQIEAEAADDSSNDDGKETR